MPQPAPGMTEEKHAWAQDGIAEAEAAQLGTDPETQDVTGPVVVVGFVVGVVITPPPSPPPMVVQDPPTGAADAQLQTAPADAITAPKVAAGQAAATQGTTAADI
jgi:hypothetical protein